MDEGADSGDILSQREVLIDDQDVAATLYEKVVETAIAQLDEFVPALAKGKNLRQQQDHAMSNTWRKRGIADGRIDWRMSAQSVHNLVRGLSRPYVGAHFDYGDGTVKVWQAVPVKECSQNHEPGKIFALRDGKPIIKCGEDAIFLIETDPPFFVPVGTYL
jgi:methionyl-tRNA formyltransferase